MPNPVGNPGWFKGCKGPNTEATIRHRDRFQKVQKKSSLERKISIYLTKRWGKMVEDMEKLSERDRVRAYIELMQYAMSKKAAVNPDGITAEQVEMLYEKLTTMVNAKAN